METKRISARRMREAQDNIIFNNNNERKWDNRVWKIGPNRALSISMGG